MSKKEVKFNRATAKSITTIIEEVDGIVNRMKSEEEKVKFLLTVFQAILSGVDDAHKVLFVSMVKHQLMNHLMNEVGFDYGDLTYIG